MVPGGQYVLLTQAIASISAEISAGKTPDGLALAGALVGFIPGAKIVKYVWKYGSVTAGAVKYGIMISSHVIDIIGMYRSISHAIETNDPLHIYQACISSGLSAKAAYETSTVIFNDIRSAKNARRKDSLGLDAGYEYIEMSTFKTSQEASEGAHEIFEMTSFITSQDVSEVAGSSSSTTLKVIQETDGGYENGSMTTDNDIQSGHHATGDEQLEGAGSVNNKRLDVSRASEGAHENIEMTSFITSQGVSEGTGSSDSTTLKVIQETDGGYVNFAMTIDDDIQSGNLCISRDLI